MTEKKLPSQLSTSLTDWILAVYLSLLTSYVSHFEDTKQDRIGASDIQNGLTDAHDKSHILERETI